MLDFVVTTNSVTSPDGCLAVGDGVPPELTCEVTPGTVDDVTVSCVPV